MGTLTGFPSPPATGSDEQARPPPRDSIKWEPSQGSQALPRRARTSKLVLPHAIQSNGNPHRVPKPSRDGLGRASSSSPTRFNQMGTLTGFPSPPATGSDEQARPPPRDSIKWEPSQGSQALPRRAR